MKDGFIRVGCATPEVRVANPRENAKRMMEQMKQASAENVKILVFPELCLTGYTCGDLFLQDTLLKTAWEALHTLADAGKEMDMLVAVGLPFMYESKLYNTAAFLKGGKILGLVPKVCLPNYNEFYEKRHFTSGADLAKPVKLPGDEDIWFGTNLLFCCETMPELVVGCEICEDLWSPCPPSVNHALHGATLITNLSASDELTGKAEYRKNLVKGQSARLICAYLYAAAGEGESTTDLVFSGDNMIAEDGACLAAAPRFTTGILTADVDMQRMRNERRRMGTFEMSLSKEAQDAYVKIPFALQPVHYAPLRREIIAMPFVPSDTQDRAKRCEEIFSIQAMGLKTRLKNTGIRSAVLGISGGLDSTLALLVTVRAFDMLQIPRDQILAVTMPCFGTTDRTYQNACRLTIQLGATLREVPIQAAVRQHFADIGQDENVHDVTYENSQARERTQVLMDIANQRNALVIGTGDLSELALGWATYNGDHMSMYGVNASVPKTLVRHLVRYYADTCGDTVLSEVLLDVLDTPVSPELLPPKEGEISQKTEDIVGPYELHDFYLYQLLRMGFSPKKIFRLACEAFAGEYSETVILRWQKVFYRRFFTQQFKRSCLPDGPKVGSVAVSPRGDWRMPSDASAEIFLQELEELKVMCC